MISKTGKRKKKLTLTPDELEKFVDEIVGEGINADEGIFGVLDQTIDRVQEQAASQEKLRKPKKSSGRKPQRVLPRMPISTPRLPEEAKGLNVTNVVNVPEKLLRRIASKVDTNTAEINNLLLSSLIPLLLSYDTGTSYAKAAMRDGLNVEIDFDDGLGEAVKHIGYLNVLFFFIKRSRLPNVIKQRFMEKFADVLAEQTLKTLIDTNKQQDRQKVAQELQAVVYSGQRKKATVHTVGEKDSDDKPKRVAPMASAKRRSP